MHVCLIEAGPFPTLEQKILSFSFLLGPGPFGPGPVWARAQIPGHLGPGSFGPGPVWTQGPFGLGPIWARAHLGPSPFGPGPVWAQACLGPGLLGPGSFPFRDQFRNCAYCLPMPIPMPGPIAIPVAIAYEGP